MVTNTAGTTARELAFQAVHYLRRSVTWDTTGIGTGVSLGIIPEGAQLLQSMTVIKTAFDGHTPALTVGTNSTAFDNIKGDGGETTTAAVIGTAANFLTFTQDTEVFIRFTNGTTSAADAGAATIVLSYVPDNDR